MQKLIIFIFCILITNNVYAGPFTSKDKLGDIFLSGSVFYAYGTTVAKEDLLGTLQLTGSIVTAQLATEALKRSVKEERPRGGSNMSFPSGHTSGAFSGAMFVHKRYGLKEAIPAYIMSGIVGWQRVATKAHYTHDVIAGAAVSALFTWLIVSDDNISISTNKKGAEIVFNLAL